MSDNVFKMCAWVKVPRPRLGHEIAAVPSGALRTGWSARPFSGPRVPYDPSGLTRAAGPPTAESGCQREVVTVDLEALRAVIAGVEKLTLEDLSALTTAAERTA